MRYFHTKCVGEDKKYDDTFCCSECRKMPDQIQELRRDVKGVSHQFNSFYAFQANHQSAVSHNLEIVIGQLQTISTELASLKENNVQLQEQFAIKCNENEQLKVKVAVLERDLENTGGERGSSQTAIPPPPSLLIGSSIIQDVVPVDDSKLQVKCLPGSNFERITDTLKMMENSNNRYETVTIAAGGIDCSNKSKSIENIRASATTVAEQAAKISNNVVFSSVLPRHDSNTTLQKILDVNPEIEQMCNQTEKVRFINNDGSFRLSDGSLNDGFFIHDQTHLTYKGTERLIKNLSLSARVRRRNRPSFIRPSSGQSSNSRNYHNSVTHENPSSRAPPIMNQTAPLMSQVVQRQGPTCRNCRLQGHYTLNCPKTARMTCYKCFQVGHPQRFCPS